MANQRVTVYVWVSLVRAKSPGHAALSLRPFASTPAEGYVSFAPASAGSIHGPGKFYNRAHDQQHYKNRGVWVGTIFGLDVQKMFQQFRQESAAPATYSPTNECANVVHRYLEAGGGDQFASRWSRIALGTWSPDDVEDYARSIIQGTSNLGSYGLKTSGEGTLF